MELGDVNVMKTPPVVSIDPQIETAMKELVADIVLSGKERYAVKPRKTKQELYRQQYIPVNFEKDRANTCMPPSADHDHGVTGITFVDDSVVAVVAVAD